MNTRLSPGRRSSRRNPTTSQRRSPPSSIASTMARSRRVRSAAINASTSSGLITRGRVRGARISGTPRTARWPGRRSARPRGTGLRSHPGVAPNDQVLIEPRDRGQPTLDGARRQPRLPVLDPHDRRATPGRALALDEGQHVGRGHGGRVPVDDREEHLQVERGGQHGVPPSAARDELQKCIEERDDRGGSVRRPAASAERTRQGTNPTGSPPAVVLT